jgi:dipeptidyl aminopeptidase/acylaminoacyl peptidase
VSWKGLGLLLGVITLLPLLNLILGIRPPTFRTSDDPGRYGLPYEDVSFTTSDGLILRGWFIPAALDNSIGRKATILVGHGYPFDKANILRHALFLQPRFHLLLFDFRYFGESEGAYTTAGLLEMRDVEAAVAYLKQRQDVDPARIGALGFSMSAAAFILSRSSDIHAIVADSAYASLEKLIERQFFFLPGPLKWPFVALTMFGARLLLGVNVKQAAPAEAVRQLTTPLLLIHGDADSQIPVIHSREIAANADPSLTELWSVPGADHGFAHAQEGARYEARVLQFFLRHLPDEVQRTGITP